MPKLNDILEGCNVYGIRGNPDTEISSVTSDSRKAGEGSLFFAIEGMHNDGHDFIDDAAGRGAAAVVCNRFPSRFDKGVTYVRVEDTATETGRIASAFYGHPSGQMKVLGITGTNGKTTTAVLLHRLFMKLGYGAGLISTVDYRINDRTMPAYFTTPDPVALQSLLSEMVSSGCSYCFMEVSSHSVVQKRIEGITFAGGIFTNITHDHLDYHEDFSAYLQAKKEFFDRLPEDAFALVNIDDKNGRLMIQNTPAAKKTFAIKRVADYKGRIIESHFDGTLLNIGGRELWTHLIGEFNAYNLLGAIAAADLLGADTEKVLLVASTFGVVPGRFEYVRSESGTTAIVDYAHTPDALENVLKTIKSLRKGKEEVITVVGSGGDRDKGKRPVMASIAMKYSNKLILTSDNPRNEDPEKIIEDMMDGIADEEKTKVLSITGRAEAIRAACMMASPGDIILVAGKGHETYQEIKGKRHHFDDREVIESAFKTKVK